MLALFKGDKDADCAESRQLDRALEILIAGLVGVSLCGLAMAAVGLFRAPQALLMGLGIAVCYALLTRHNGAPRGKFRPGRITLHIAAIVIVGLLFRLPAINYVSGGQDQGVYVNMASHIVHTGGFAIHDNILKSIGDQKALERYSSDNHPKTTDFLLGIFYKGSPDSGNLEFQFYHLFPVWMAVSGGIFGLNAAVWALTFLAILSLVFFYRLAFELTGRSALGLLAGMLLALNPLHAFFSRFPVTELPTLCFTLSGFWLLLAAWRRRDDEDVRGKILLSLLTFGCAFLTRVSGFMYVPTFILIGILACVYEERIGRKKMLLAWVAGVLTVYAMTVVYGLVFSRIYVDAMYNASFGKVFGSHWHYVIGTVMAAFCLILFLLYKYPEYFDVARRLRRIFNSFSGWLGFIPVVVLLPWAAKLYSLGFTGKYASDPTINDRWHIAGLGFGVLKYSSLVVAAEYVGPLILIAFFVLAWRRRFDAPLSILLAFVISFLCYVCLLQWLTLYQPYYARYLVSEFVPYLLLFVVAASAYVSSGVWRRSIHVVFGITLFYGGVLSGGQVHIRAQQGMAASYARIASHVGDGDLLLLDISSLTLPDQLIEMPLMLRYGRNVARITEPNLGNPRYLNVLQRNYDDLFLLSGNPVAPVGFDMITSVRLREVVAIQGHAPPLHSRIRFTGRTFLYVRHGAGILPGDRVMLNSGIIGQSAGGWRKMLVSGWSSPESWGIWSDESEARIHIPARLSDGSRPDSLVLGVRGFLTENHRQQALHVTVNGEGVLDTVLKFPVSGDITLTIPLRADIREHEGYDIVFRLPDAASPTELGVGKDGRKLGVGLISGLLVSGK